MRLELQKLCAGYGGGSVLREISAGFETGQLSVIVGRNGAGKSTLLRAMSGMLPAGGTAALAGAPIHALPGTQRAMGLGYLPQRLRTPDMTVQTLVSHGRFSRLGFSKTLGGEDKEKIRQALEQTGMTELRFRTLPTLSGGELQRAYCAMVIAQDPDFLLLDEPTAFLDAEASIQLAQILRALTRAGKGVVLSCHDLPLAFSIADRVLVLHGGTLVLDAAPDLAARQEKTIFDAVGVRLKRIDDPDAFCTYILAKPNDNT